MNHLRLILGLFLLSASAQAALVQFIETSVNDADGSTIGAVASSQFRETTLSYSTTNAPATWSSYRFTHWTNSGYPEMIYRDAWGRSLNPSNFVLLVASTATAHYLPATRDTDADGVPDWYEIEYFGNLDRTADSDTDGDGRTLLAEYTAGTNPLYGNSSLEGGVAWSDSALVTCNLAGYPTYTLRSVPAGTVNQSATVLPGTVVTTTNLSANATFGYWTLDGVRQQDPWGVAYTQLTFTLTTTDREAVAYLFTGDTDADGVPDAYEQRYYGTLANAAVSDTDGDGITLLAEYTAGTNPLYGNSSLGGGVAWADSALVTCNLAGYPTYTLRSVPAGTVNQTATVTSGTVITTANLSGNATFGYWTLDGVRQQDVWGVAYTQLTFTLTTTDREAVAYLFTGDTDADGVPDAYEQRYYGTLTNAGDSDTDGDGRTLLAEYTAGTNPLFGNSSLEGGVAWADSALITADLQPEIAVSRPAGTDLPDGGTQDFGSILVGTTTDLTFTVENHGGTDLTGLGITIDGANAAEFTVTATPTAPVGHLGSTTFTIRFAPASVGAKTAALHIANNDANENPFDLSLAGVGLNNPPTISSVPDTNMARNTPNGALGCTVGDVETATAALTVSGASSNQALIPDASIVVDGSGSLRMIHLTPAANQTGTAIITLTVSDGSHTAATTFTVTVTAYPPLVATGAASALTATAATLSGTVNPQGFASTAQFEYGLTTGYGSSANVTLGPADGSGVQSVSAAITGLETLTTYHYRLTASSNQGAAAGDDATFTTAGVAPVITTQPQSQTVSVGRAICFTAEASGTPAPSYQWRKDGVPITGATSAMLALGNARLETAGSYDVVATNSAGSETSAAAVLTVDAASVGTVVAWGMNDNGQTTIPAGLGSVTAVVGGGWHTMALRSDGTVATWGLITTLPPGLNNVTAIAAGHRHSVFLKSDGNVVAWGDNDKDQTAVPAGLSGVTAVAAGGDHTLALKSDGTVVAWGDNYYGQINVPSGLANVVAVAAGSGHSLALRNNGTVIAWGWNGYGYGQVDVPAGLDNVIAIAAGGNHNVALKSDGSVVIWGESSNGLTAVPAGLSNVTAVSAGAYHSVALKGDGTIAAWGNNYYGQSAVFAGLGNVTAIATGYSHTAALVPADADFVPMITTEPQAQTVVAGNSVTFTVAATGTPAPTYQWRKGGVNIAGATSASYTIADAQTGDAGSYTVVVTNPARSVLSNAALLRVTATVPGTVTGWGNNSYGQMNVPVDLSNVTALAAGYYHTVALRNDGSVFAWGDNGSGQTTVPADLGVVIAVAARASYTVALKSDGTVVVWGENIYGQRNVPAGLSNVTAISAGGEYVLALKSDGTVVAWGNVFIGGGAVPAGLSGVIAIAAGSGHSVALKSDGTVVAWGDNFYGQATVPDGLTDVTAIAAGNDHTVALKSDGTVVAWGSNYSGESVVPAGLNGVTAIAAGPNHTVALKSDGTVVAWGWNGNGQTTVPDGLSNVTAIAAGLYHTLVILGPLPAVAPTITTQPAGVTVNVGAGVSFGVTATGTAPLSYQWMKDGVNVSGATGDTLMLTNVQTTDAGSYTVVVTNTADSATSTAAVLTVNRLAQTISFEALPDKPVTAAPFTPGATASSGLAVSYASSNPLVATVSGNTVTITGTGTTTIAASQAGDATYLPAVDVSQTLNVTGTGSSVLVTDDFTGTAGAPPDAAKFEWGGQVALTGAGQVNLSTDTASTSWLWSKAGAAPGVGETLVLQMRLYAYAEDWNPGVYGNQQPRGLRVGTDANNAVEFYSASTTSLGLRVRKDGVESGSVVAFPARVDAMHDYEITVTTTEVTFKVDGVVLGTFTTNIPTGVLNAYIATSDGGAGNVPVSIESLSLTFSGSAAPTASFSLWQAAYFTPTEISLPSVSGPNAVYGEDGLPNLVKYALGLDPKVNIATGLPFVSTIGAEWAYTYTRPTDRPDVTYSVEVSTNLQTWTTDSVVHERVSTAGDQEIWQARYPLNSAPSVFFRLKVLIP